MKNARGGWREDHHRIGIGVMPGALIDRGDSSWKILWARPST